MVKVTTNSLPTMPEAYISVSKGRQKIHGDKVYLNEGTEFEIELFNPTQHTLEARISLNGKLIGQTGLIIKPGQRVFLERFFDVQKKFKFETYEVENTEEVAEAIAKNGAVQVSFYKEKEKQIPINNWWNTNPNWNSNITTYGTSTYTTGNNTFFSNTRGMTNHDVDFKTTSSLKRMKSVDQEKTRGIAPTNLRSTVTMDSFSRDFDNQSLNFVSSAMPEKVETGRVEQGSKSNQDFSKVYVDVESFAMKSITYQILPVSTKPVEVAEVVKNFCCNCGSKVKQKDNFCRVCGNKL